MVQSGENGGARRRRRSMTSRVTMAQVAARAGVSSQTVSRVLRQPELVGEDVSRRVHEAISELQYIPNFAASHLASNKSGIVAAIIPTISTSMFAEGVQALSDVLVPEGYQILLGNDGYSLEKEEELIRSFLARGADGLVLSGSHHTDAAKALISSAGVPVVELWDSDGERIDLLVGHSNVDAAFAMTHYLFERGYRRIVFAGVVHDQDYRGMARLAGYRKAIQGLAPEAECVFSLKGQPLSHEGGVAALSEIRKLHPDVDAIFFASDVYAVGALQECVRRGISVPEELAVAGFGDFEISAHLVPSLTTVSVHAQEIGQNAAKLLLARMRGEAVKARKIDVGFDLIVRAST